ncbi:SH3 domain-containing protein [Pseudodesulfovibrio senegalensis]|uniref:SH3 domain-containing protein n=1 Tax=Pseudodesulfovibrio senegalensis TaxID=1721087 RepID=A0A6N6N5Y2_9BACT|nr:SH3 domain-containing protein [Pseudodesulfovibrio senegalensis]KAB1443474.1 SH3 domain-containing protein [Pseudodesulfovibrio senegalensis]
MRRAVILTLWMVLLCAAAASAAEFGEIRYPDRTLNLRVERSPKAEWVGILQAGQPVRVAYLKDGWVAVFEPYMKTRDSVKVAGYANVKYLNKKRSKVEEKSWGAVMHPRTAVNIRSKRNARSSKMGKLVPGTNVRVDFPEDGWVAVLEDRATIRSKLNVRGFVKSTYLLPGPVAGTARKPASSPEAVQTTPPATGEGQVRGSVAPAPKTQKAEKAEEHAVSDTQDREAKAQTPVKPWGTVITAKHKVRIRKERSMTSHFVKTVAAGERIKIDFPKNGWFAVFEPDATVRSEQRALGYVLAEHLKKGEPVTVTPRPESLGNEGAKEARPAKPIIIKPDPLAASARPAPKGDKYLHGVHYKLLEKAETSRNGVDVVDMKIFVDVKQLPKATIMEDFAKSLWKEHRRSNKLLVIHIFLPEMDLDDISFIEAVYSHDEPLEFWARRTALYGTRFMDQ